jgi:hypothetical protein
MHQGIPEIAIFSHAGKTWVVVVQQTGFFSGVID